MYVYIYIYVYIYKYIHNTGVHVVGRRGPVQAAFTIAELREIVNLKNINVFTKNNELLLDDVDEQVCNILFWLIFLLLIHFMFICLFL